MTTELTSTLYSVIYKHTKLLFHCDSFKQQILKTKIGVVYPE